MKTARENILIHGLIDWVRLSGVHSYVLQENRTAPPSELQQETLEMIHSLVSDGLVELGDLAGQVRTEGLLPGTLRSMSR
jgi:hypothetical protein